MLPRRPRVGADVTIARGLLLLVVLTAAVGLVTGTYYAPNHFFGQCLTKDWVAATEAKYSISAKERDGLSRLLHPHLHPALKAPRFWLKDPRTTVPMSQLYGPDCATKGAIYGVGGKRDPTDGSVTDKGRVNGTLVVEWKGWASSAMATMVFSILAQEALGYDVSYYSVADSNYMGQRMSSVHTGQCSPVHANLEEWGRNYEIYANESYKAGTHTYTGRSGIYTTKDFVTNGTDPALYSPTFNADFWRDYTKDEQLISALSVGLLKNNSKYYPPKELACADGVMGCLHSCSKSDTCTAHEAKGKDCMVVALMYPFYDEGRTESMFANNKIPAYFCHLGYSAVQDFAVESHRNRTPVVFYHFEPDPFHVLHDGKFERITFPRPTPELYKLSTATFGENGYGNKTNNPFSVDFVTSALFKYGASVLNDNEPVATFLSRISFEEGHMKDLLKLYVNLTNAGGAVPIIPEDLEFSAACSWIRDNYMAWRLWIDRLPQCSLFTHIAFTPQHCDDGKPREIAFQWINPDPEDPTRPYTCDGGEFAQLPPPLETSRSCEWIRANSAKWFAWIFDKPQCDASFYEYRVSACDARSKRTIQYHWLLEDPTDASRSRECNGGVTLPDSMEIDCEYTPHSAPIFKVIVALAGVHIALLVFMVGFVHHYRQEPIIKRSQWEFLTVMIVGGILMCGATIVYAGAPTPFLCGARPAITSTAFTLIFGSLVVKSLRVYRVFLSGAMKRVVLSTFTMFKILGMFLMVDGLILLAWFVADFPAPMTSDEPFAEVGGGPVQVQRCHSASFIFTALLIFWKAIVLGMGIYLSFLIRNVSTDFQESIWIFVSSVVVLFGSILVLPMAYLIDLPAQIFYIFLSFALLGCTAMVMGMMLLPKIRRLHEQAPATTRETTTSAGTSRDTSESTTVDNPSAAKSSGKLRLPFKATSTVTPVQEYEASESSEGKKKKSVVEMIKGNGGSGDKDKKKQKKKKSNKDKGESSSSAEEEA